MKPARLEKLRRLLETPLQECLEGPRPLAPFRRLAVYSHPRDYELGALLVCLLDFGPREGRTRCLDQLFNRLGDKPARVLGRANRQMTMELVRGLAFGFLEERDLELLLHVLKQAIRQQGNLEELYRQVAEHHAGQHLQNLDRFMLRLARSLSAEERARRGLGHLLPRPARGSSVRRLHLFLRHMARSVDGGDAGIWSCLRPKDLYLPLDQPQHKLLLSLKLSTRTTCNRGAVVEASRNLALLDPEDPLRYSLALEQLVAAGVEEEELNRRFRRA